MSSVVEVLLRAKDEASAVAKRSAASIKAAFAGVTKHSQGVTTALGKAGRGVGAIGSLGAKAFGVLSVGALGATAAIGAVGGLAMKIATDSQEALQSLAGATNNWASLTGDSWDKSKVVMEGLTKELGKQAATLPGTTQQYVAFGNAIADNVVNSFTDLNGVVNKSKAINWLKDTTANLEILRQASGATEKQSAIDVSNFLGGTYKSEKGMMATQFWASNPTMMTNLRKAAKEFGFDSVNAMLKGANAQQRAEILQLAASRSVTKELKDELGNSIDGAVEGLKTQLFDPNVGLFGGLRKFDFRGKSVDMNRAMGTILNEMSGAMGGMFGHIGKGLELAGFETDPLVILSQTMDLFNSGLKSVSSMVQGIKIGDIASFFLPLKNMFDKLAEIGSQMKIGDILRGGEGGNIGEKLGQMFATMQNTFLSVFSNPGAIYAAVFNFTSQLMNMIGSYLMNLNWGGVLTAIASFGAAIIAVVLSVVMNLILALGQGLTMLFSSIGSMLGPIFMGGLSMLGGFLMGAGALLLAVFMGIGTFLMGLIMGAVGLFMSAVSMLGMALSTAVSTFMSGVSQIGSGVVSAIQGWIGAAMGAVGAFAGWGAQIAGAIQSGAAAIGSAIVNAVQGMMEAAKSAASSIGGMLRLPGGGGAKYAGHNQTALYRTASEGRGQHSLLGAMALERKKMPVNSEPVIANSSEAIIPRNQFGAMARMMSKPLPVPVPVGVQSGGPVQVSVNAPITIHTQPGMDPQSIYESVVQALQDSMDQSLRTQLA